MNMNKSSTLYETILAAVTALWALDFRRQYNVRYLSSLLQARKKSWNFPHMYYLRCVERLEENKYVPNTFFNTNDNQLYYKVRSKINETELK